MQILSVLRPKFLNETPQCHFSFEPLTYPLYRCSHSHGAATQFCRQLYHDRPSSWPSASLHSIPGYMKWSATFSSVLLMGQEWFREDWYLILTGAVQLTFLLPYFSSSVIPQWWHHGKPQVSLVPRPLTRSTPTAHNSQDAFSLSSCLSFIYTCRCSSQVPHHLSEWTAKIHCSLITQSRGYLHGLAHLISTTTYHVRTL